MTVPAERLKEVTTYYFARKLAEIDTMNKDGQAMVINLGIGSPDLPPHPSVIEALHRSSLSADAHKYQPYKGTAALRNAFGNWYLRHFGVEVDADKQILPLIGSKEGVMHISMAFVNPGDQVLVPDPGYPSYSMCTRLAGGVPITMPLEEKLGWKPDLKKLSDQDLSRVRIMWVNYPNMPTGTVADVAFFEELISFAAEHDILVCHDNPYAFLLTDTPVSIFNVRGAAKQALELTSLSKCYNMAGWRVGAVTGNKEYIDAVLAYKSNMDSGMFRPVLDAAVVALGLGDDWITELNNTYAARKKAAFAIFDQLGLEYNPDGAGIFVWGRIKDNHHDGESLSANILSQSRVFITPGHVFGNQGQNYLRISLCSPIEDMEAALYRIRTGYKAEVNVHPKNETI